MKIDEEFISDRREALAELERCEALKDTCHKISELLEIGGSAALELCIRDVKNNRLEYQIKVGTNLTALNSSALPAIYKAINEEVHDLEIRQKELIAKYFPLKPGESLNE